MENYATKNTDVFLSARRFPEYEEIGICRREPFQRDRDRIMHSRSFRRMMHKTQIFNANMGDHYRNRLTHTLEVAQISRSIGKVLGLNDELIEAIALGHDLGHTPFGHIGERTLDGILHNGLNTNIPATGGRFKHNFQSLKVVDQLETRCEDYAGINLTLATREGILKHTKTAYAGEGFLHYPELDFSNIDLSAPSFTLEGQVVAISDEIAQCTHDLEDGVRSKIISFSDIQNYPLVLQVIKKYDIFIPRSTVTPTYDTRNLIIKNLVGFLIEDVCIESQKRISLYTKKCGIPDANKGGFKELCISFSPDIEKAVLELLSFIKRLIVCSEQITISDSKSKNIISSLFEAFYLHPKQLPDYALSKYCKQAEIIFDRLSLDDFRLQQDPAFVRAISDHIAGMTDQYAARTFTLLSQQSKIVQLRDDAADEAVFLSDNERVWINRRILETLPLSNMPEFQKALDELIHNYDIRNTIEIEKKYHFSDEAVFQDVLAYLKTRDDVYSFDKSPAFEQVDSYYDTPDKLVESAKSTLRIRHKDCNYEITIKCPTPVQIKDNGQNERFEFCHPISSNSLSGEEAFIVEHVPSLKDKTSELKNTLTIINKREIINILAKKSEAKFEMAFDHVTYQDDSGHKAYDYQIEIELKSDYIHRVNLKMLTDDLERKVSKLESSTESKYKRGLTKLSVQ